MISMSSYQSINSNNYKTCSISGDRGKQVNYQGACFPKLVPKKDFWQIWHDNIGIVSEEENNRYYIEQYYQQVLSKLDPEDIYRKLDNSILLCYEENTEFCHRHIVAEWLQLLLNIEVPEVIEVKGVYGSYLEGVVRPDFIKKYLEDVMRKDQNIIVFQSLHVDKEETNYQDDKKITIKK